MSNGITQPLLFDRILNMSRDKPHKIVFEAADALKRKVREVGVVL